MGFIIFVGRGVLLERAFLLRRLLRYGVAEVFFEGGKVAPSAWSVGLWDWTLALNPQHVGGALERAQLLTERTDPRAEEAFEAAERVIENVARMSASDLALTVLPQRILERALRRDGARAERTRQEIYFALTSKFGKKRESTFGQDHSAEVRRRTVAERWDKIEREWVQKEYVQAFANAAPCIERGDFVSPLDALKWAERALEMGDEQLDLAERCLGWAETWVPERAKMWQLRGELARRGGELARAEVYLERAASLEPENVEIFLARQRAAGREGIKQAEDVRLGVMGPNMPAVGDVGQVECVVENGGDGWEVYALPPNGGGIRIVPRMQRVDGKRRAIFQVQACRPDRVRGGDWTLRFVGMKGSEYIVAKIGIAVADGEPGKFLLLVTEDHELWEERGTIPQADVEKLLVEKSNFAAEQFAPWTHMVEAGSALALLDWAAGEEGAWKGTRDAAYDHLRVQLKQGNDIQPHLHAFNLLTSSEFPYAMTSEGLELDKTFLLTAEERRRDFARAYTSRERIAAVAETVARLERIGQAVDPGYRAVLWRSGQLEFGDDAAERAWSSVALLRAGLFADSDMGKKTFPFGTLPQTAFFAELEAPFEPHAGGEILQLPVTNNLEGDFLSDGETLREIAKQTGEKLRGMPGVNVVTLLTHDKFINARRGGDEFCLDASYNEWAMIRGELNVWREQGAKQVTAREAIRELLDDGAWRLTAWLCRERAVSNGVAYTIQLLGKGIMVSEEFPHWVLVTIPPYLRADVAEVRVRQGEYEVTTDQYSADHFWVRVTEREPEMVCEFELRGQDAAK